MKLYRVVASVIIREGIREYKINVYVFKAKDTSTNYIWKGRRFPKKELNMVKKCFHTSSMIGFETYATEEGRKEAELKTANELYRFIRDESVKFAELLVLVEKDPMTEVEVLDDNGHTVHKYVEEQ